MVVRRRSTRNRPAAPITLNAPSDADRDRRTVHSIHFASLRRSALAELRSPRKFFFATPGTRADVPAASEISYLASFQCGPLTGQLQPARRDPRKATNEIALNTSRCS